VRIRPVHDGETAEAERLLTTFFVEEGFPLPPEGLDVRLRRYVTLPHHVALVAVTGRATVGVATVTANFGLEYGWAAELEDLYVLPSHRGRGLARGLVQAAGEWARSEGCTAMLVTVTPEGQEAHHLMEFYRNLGFSDHGRRLLELPLRSDLWATESTGED
jgi:GNAT superfamily N-acetyltransferase